MFVNARRAVPCARLGGIRRQSTKASELGVAVCGFDGTSIEEDAVSDPGRLQNRQRPVLTSKVRRACRNLSMRVSHVGRIEGVRTGEAKAARAAIPDGYEGARTGELRQSKCE